MSAAHFTGIIAVAFFFDNKQRSRTHSRTYRSGGGPRVALLDFGVKLAAGFRVTFNVMSDKDV